MKKSFLAKILLFSLTFAIFAQENEIIDKPVKAKTQAFSVAAEGVFAFPVGFTGDQKIAGTGFGAALELGYNFNGWIPAVKAEYRKNFEDGNLMVKMDNIFVTAEISKVLDKSIISFFPEWFGFRPSFGIGFDFLITENYPNQLYKDKGITNDSKATCLVYDIGIEFEFFASEKIVPYAGFDINFAGDKSGTFVYSGLNLGFRYNFCKPKGYKADSDAINENKEEKTAEQQQNNSNSVEKTKKPEIKLSPDKNYFTPDGDGKDDQITFNLKNAKKEVYKNVQWKMEVIETFGKYSKTIKTYSGNGELPDSISWDGSGDDNLTWTGKDGVTRKRDFKPFSASDYKVKLTVNTEDGDVVESESVAKVGILVIPQDNGTLKIQIPSFVFDADKATFDTLTDRQKRSNQMIVKMISRAISKYPEYSVKVEGHGNNLSGSEKEETEEVQPLSKERADAVCNLLINAGVNSERLSSVGKGGKEPVTSDKDELWKNRRVDFILLK